jgi:uncharacterized protein YidB (DUF937 family)
MRRCIARSPQGCRSGAWKFPDKPGARPDGWSIIDNSVILIAVGALAPPAEYITAAAIGGFGMGLLDQVLGSVTARPGSAQAKPGLGSTVAAGVVLALLVKGVRQYQATHGQGVQPAGSADPQHPASGATGTGSGGLGGLLGGLIGGGGLGGLLTQFGGAGALSTLISHLQQKGLRPQVGSWVSQGENQTIAPEQLGEALGPDTVQVLQQQTGMPRDTLLSELSRDLPDAVSQVTPAGRVPSDQELHQIASQPPLRPRYNARHAERASSIGARHYPPPVRPLDDGDGRTSERRWRTR